ncbi:hypothetical protein L0222_02570 [bacterium]|nr:hypothetical protein [bacterium]
MSDDASIQIVRYSKQIVDSPNDPRSLEEAYASRARAYLNIANLEAALSDYGEAEKIRNASIPDLRFDHYVKMCGVILWLQKKREEARDVWIRIVNAIDADEIRYSDAAGGILNAALVIFSSIFLRNPEHRANAESFISKQIKSKRIDEWPTAIGYYLLHKISESELYDFCKSKSKLMEYRKFSQAYFYASAVYIEKGDFQKFLTLVNESMSVGAKNVLLEPEFYIAKHEATEGLIAPPTSTNSQT